MSEDPTASSSSASAHWLNVACLDDSLLIQVHGLGNMHLALTLKELLLHPAYRHVKEVVIDLDPCTGLDSTFMGTLITLAEELHKKRRGSLRLLNVNTTCEKVLALLGLDTLLTYCSSETTTPDIPFTRVDPIQDKVDERLKLIEKVHRRLIDLSEDNRKRFGAFLTMIEQDKTD